MLEDSWYEARWSCREGQWDYRDVRRTAQGASHVANWREFSRLLHCPGASGNANVPVRLDGSDSRPSLSTAVTA